MSRMNLTNPPPKENRISAQSTNPENIPDFEPIDMSKPLRPIEVPSNEPVAESPSFPEDPATPAENETAQESQKNGKVGRPKGSGNKTKKNVPSYKTAKPKRTDMDEDKKRHTSLYLYPGDHKRLRALALDNDFSVTGFAESACLDAMYHSYLCNAPDCNCEFIVRASLKDGDPCCPMCQGKKLQKLYGR